MLGKCRPKAYSTLYSAMLSNKNMFGGRGGSSKAAVVMRLAGHWSVCGTLREIATASLAFLISFLHLFNCLYLYP